MDLGLTDRVVIISGAGQGIGLATARAFATEGSVVVGLDLRPEALAAVPGRHPVEARTVDVTAPGAIEAAVGGVVARHGRVDVLVNNVGVAPFRGNGFLGVERADWDETLGLNFFSMVEACRYVLPHMIAAGTGSIVSIASDAARQPDPFFVDYAVSKAAILSLSKSLSIEFGPSGIRSNCIAPGPTETPAMESFLEDLAGQLGLPVEEAASHFAVDMRGLPLGRLNTPDEVACVIVFLASDAARQVTGSTYGVDAGSLRYV